MLPPAASKRARTGDTPPAAAAGSVPALAKGPASLQAAAREVLSLVVYGPLGSSGKHKYLHMPALVSLLGAVAPGYDCQSGQWLCDSYSS